MDGAWRWVIGRGRLTGDEVTGVVADRDRLMRAAVWSPTGLNAIGGALLVVMSNHGVVSVYAPEDAYNQAWTEVRLRETTLI